MRTVLITSLVATSLVAGCGSWGDSRRNPTNWFGRSQPVEISEPGEVNPLIPAESKTKGVFSKPEAEYAGVLIQSIAELKVERTQSGAIIRATGLAARSGAYNARLVPDHPDELPDENGVLSYQFDVFYPLQATPQGSDGQRRIMAARTRSTQELAGVKTIRITGEPTRWKPGANKRKAALALRPVF